MLELTEKEKENVSQFIELTLSLLQRGFDEMKMSQRMKLVKLFGLMCNIGVDKVYERLIDHEKRICSLEKKIEENYDSLLNKV